MVDFYASRSMYREQLRDLDYYAQQRESLTDWQETWVEAERAALETGIETGRRGANPVPYPVPSGLPGNDRAREKWEAYQRSKAA